MKNSALNNVSLIQILSLNYRCTKLTYIIIAINIYIKHTKVHNFSTVPRKIKNPGLKKETVELAKNRKKHAFRYLLPCRVNDNPLARSENLAIAIYFHKQIDTKKQRV